MRFLPSRNQVWELQKGESEHLYPIAEQWKRQERTARSVQPWLLRTIREPTIRSSDGDVHDEIES